MKAEGRRQKAEGRGLRANGRCAQGLCDLRLAIGYLRAWAPSLCRSRIVNRQWPTWLSAVLLLLALAGVAIAEQRFPPPDFESGHHLPVTTTLPARAVLFQYLDMAVLAASL